MKHERKHIDFWLEMPCDHQHGHSGRVSLDKCPGCSADMTLESPSDIPEVREIQDKTFLCSACAMFLASMQRMASATFVRHMPKISMN